MASRTFTGKLLSVVISYNKDDFVETLFKTLQSFLGQEGAGKKFKLELIVWCRGRGLDTVERVSTPSLEARLGKNAGRIKVIESSTSFLANIYRSVALLAPKNPTHYFLVNCGVVPRPTCITFFLNKLSEYGENTPLTAFGFRLFPHEKLGSPHCSLEDGMHYKFYTASHHDRAVHVFTTKFICLSRSTLDQLAEYKGDTELSSLGHLWCSFVAGHHLKIPIWKIDTEGIIDFSFLSHTNCPLIDVALDSSSISAFDRLYNNCFVSDWPAGIYLPPQSPHQLQPLLKNQDTCAQLWERGFGGVNMLLEPASRLDFAAAAVHYGIKVIRVGAVGDAKDLSYLLDGQASSIEEDSAHLAKVLPRLRHALFLANERGLKVIITLVDLPGSPFTSLSDQAPLEFWKNPTQRLRAAKFWGVLSEHLVDLNHLVMGYDIINEPFTEEDREVGFFDTIPVAQKDILNEFYHNVISEIRCFDKDTAIILKCTWFASPVAMNILEPLNVQNIKYSFHCYLPPHLTLQRSSHFAGRRYPGELPKDIYALKDRTKIDKNFLHRLLKDHVSSWQKQHNIPSKNILVAEFGICREVPGATTYLQDLVELFGEFGWSWLLFSFRDEEWDAMDYELGEDLVNMLHRSPSDMFMAVAKHFH